ncbi:type II secretion system F family protein [Roseibium alexandrii]
MKHFRYSAFTSKGQRQSGVLEALSKDAAYSVLQGMGLTPIDLTEDNSASAAANTSSSHRPQSTNGQLVLRTMRMLAILITRKVAIPDALSVAAEAEPTSSGKKTLLEVRKKVAEGQSMSSAMAKTKDFASTYLVSMITAGESTATLGAVLERLAGQMEKDLELNRKINSALAYPAVLTLASVCLLAFISLYMVPALMPLLEQNKAGIPPLIDFMHTAATAISDNAFAVLAGLLLALAAIIAIRRHPAAKQAFHEVIFRMPVLGKMLASSETIRLCSSLGLMLSNHVDLVKALSISKETARTAYFANAIEAAAPALKEGQSLHEAFSGFDRFPSTFKALARAGSETRALPEALSQIADIQRAILEKQIETAVKILPPVLTLMIGGFIGLFVLVIVDTIMGLNDAIY